MDLGSLGRAARLLRVSQPALSKRLRALEALAGAQLLDRSPRGVTPTPAGTRLYVEARKLLVQAEAVDELMSGLPGDEPAIRLAASHTIAEFVLPGPLVEFEQRRERHLSVELILANSVLVRELVRDGRAEFGIAAVDPAATRSDSLTELDFCNDEVIVAVPPGHPWASKRSIDPKALATTPLIVRDPSANTRRTVEWALEQRGLSLAPPLAEVGSTSAAKETALAEGAPVLLSRLAVGDDSELLVRRLKGLTFDRRFIVLLGGEETLTPTARALIDHLRGAVAAMVGSRS